MEKVKVAGDDFLLSNRNARTVKKVQQEGAVESELYDLAWALNRSPVVRICPNCNYRNPRRENIEKCTIIRPMCLHCCDYI